MRSVESGFSELPLWRRIAGILLIVALSGTFFFSGWSKIHSDNAFNSFHWTFLDIGLPGLGFTGILARIMIGFEFFLGFLLISHVYLKSFTYKAVMGLLLIFIAYLAYLLIKE
ncbi:MAG: hypothetical protein EBX41_08960, partial [Chitinophagia bacterium]|nr:hypothetical protein [Chitinophagia bacterium]